MMSKPPEQDKKNESPLDLLPWLVNGSLDARERGEVEAALRASDEARSEFASIHRLSASVRQQGETPLSDDSWAKLRARSVGSAERALPSAEGSYGTSFNNAAPAASAPVFARLDHPVIARVLVAFTVLLLVAGSLWALLRPGTHVAFTATADEAVTFRIYRGNPETEAFELWREVPAASEAASYDLVDHRPVTGPRVYRIEAVGQGELIAFRETVIAGGWAVALTQMAILVLALVAMALALQRMETDLGRREHSMDGSPA
jgi:hypothetical protein